MKIYFTLSPALFGDENMLYIFFLYSYIIHFRSTYYKKKRLQTAIFFLLQHTCVIIYHFKSCDIYHIYKRKNGLCFGLQIEDVFFL